MSSMSIPIMTIRFSDATWDQNCMYRTRFPEIGCIYGPTRKTTSKIPDDSLVFVIEMNNTQNKVQGIGLIRNKVNFEKNYRVYEAGNYNRYIYKSKYRLDRDVLTSYHPELVSALDYILFKEKTHLKRGCGFTRVPDKLWKHEKCRCVSVAEENDMRKEIETMFRRHFAEIETETETEETTTAKNI